MKRIPQKSSGRLLLYVLLLAVTLGIMFSLKHCRRWTDGPLPASGGGDTLRVAMQLAPGSFYSAGDSLAGTDYEALRALGLPFVITPITNPATGLKGLDEGRYDLVVADLPQTADMDSRYIFTTPVYLDRQVLVQRVDSAGAAPAITSPLQLADMTVVTVKDSPMASRIRNLERETGVRINLLERDATSERLLLELALGADSVPLVVVNGEVARALASDFPNLDCSMPISMTQFQPWILRASDAALRDTLNARLARRP